MSYDLGGFSISASTSRTMLVIFAVYTVVIVGFGFISSISPERAVKTAWPPS